MPELERLRCAHIEREGRGPNQITLGDGKNVLDLCDHCMTIVRGAILEQIIQEALRQVFEVKVGQ